MIIGSRIIYRENTHSTNTLAAGMLRMEKLPEGTVVRAGYQSAGRGQAGNRWESERGKNLLVSIILFPDFIEPGEQFLISMTISLGIRDFIRRHYQNCMVKWPNDIYSEDCKIAGILIENSILGKKIESSIAGIGLNINQVEFTSDAPNPVSLLQLTGREFDLSECLTQLAADLDNRYKQLVSGKYHEIRQEYLSSLYRFREWHSFRSAGRIFTGRIISVTGSGHLQVEDQRAVINEYSFNEIDFIHKASPTP